MGEGGMTSPLMMRRRAMGKGGPLVSDSFDRPDSTTSLGTADTGQVWTNFGTGMGIAGNKAYGPTAINGEHGAVVDAGVGNASVVVTYSDINAFDSQSSGLAGRWADINNFWRFDHRLDTGGWRLLKRSAGTYTQPASGGTVERGTMKLVMSASTVECHVGSTLLGSVADSFGATVTKHGLFVEDSSHRFDDFKVEVP